MITFDDIKNEFLKVDGVEESTMMKSDCIRYEGDFVSMYFDKEESLIVKLPENRVNELIEKGIGNEFKFTKKRFKEWLLIPQENDQHFIDLVKESIDFVKGKKRK